MAEADVEGPLSTTRCYCHKCNVEITPRLPEYLCPRCDCGFIEIVHRTQDPDSDGSSDSDQEFMTFEFQTGPYSVPLSGSTSGSSSSAGPRRSQRFRPTLNPRPGRRRVSDGDRQSALAPLLHELLMVNAIETGFGPQYGLFPGISFAISSDLVSNPGDYAWGRGGLDAIITQLMNQLDSTGPPPLPQEKIMQIPVIEITKEQCDIKLQCPVCMDDFKLGEKVKQLHCEHCYHKDCIIPWLELHGTCPVCRKYLTDIEKQENSNPASSTGGAGTSHYSSTR